MIIYRLYPGRYFMMYKIFLTIAVAEIVGTTLETVVVFWLWSTLWKQWTLPFKIVTPILHALFSAAQLFGAWIFWKLARKERSKLESPQALGQQETEVLGPHGFKGKDDQLE